MGTGKLYQISGDARAYIDAECKARGKSATEVVRSLMANSRWSVLWDRCDLINKELQSGDHPKQWRLDAEVYAQAIYSLTLLVQQGKIEPQAATNGIMYTLQNREMFEKQRIRMMDQIKLDIKAQSIQKAREQAQAELAELPRQDEYIVDTE